MSFDNVFGRLLHNRIFKGRGGVDIESYFWPRYFYWGDRPLSSVSPRSLPCMFRRHGCHSSFICSYGHRMGVDSAVVLQHRLLLIVLDLVGPVFDLGLESQVLGREGCDRDSK